MGRVVPVALVFLNTAPQPPDTLDRATRRV